MSLQVYETDGSLADPTYFAALAAHLENLEQSQTRCRYCDDYPVVTSGLCHSCAWNEYDPRQYDEYDHYADKHGV